MRQHRALAGSGRAAGVDDSREVVGLLDGDLMPVAVGGGLLQQASATVSVKGEHMRHPATVRLASDRADPVEVPARTDDERRLGIADEVLHLAALVGGVERQVDQARAQHRQVQHQGLDRLLGLRGDSRRPRAGRATRAGSRSSRCLARDRARCRRGARRRRIRSPPRRDRRERPRAAQRTGCGCRSRADAHAGYSRAVTPRQCVTPITPAHFLRILSIAFPLASSSTSLSR